MLSPCRDVVGHRLQWYFLRSQHPTLSFHMVPARIGALEHTVLTSLSTKPRIGGGGGGGRKV